MFCKKCGKELGDAAKFCPACGTEIEKVAPVAPAEDVFADTVNEESELFEANTETIKAMPAEDLPEIYAQLVKENKEYYLPKFVKFKKGGDAFDYAELNWASFFFTYLWLAYRKAYLAAFIGILANIVMNYLPFGFIIRCLVWGFYGNFFYYKHLERVIEDINMTPEINRDYEIDKKSGTSWVLPIILLIPTLIAMIIFGVFSAFLIGAM